MRFIITFCLVIENLINQAGVSDMSEPLGAVTEPMVALRRLSFFGLTSYQTTEPGQSRTVKRREKSREGGDEPMPSPGI
ncbi:hypothetical protein chiPu_0002243 [Chiloscyllium punctatum]|uniref:Uncharacterized protein n=1 Tax=Chiloscyllium punctatum TaxID=137246 RepID=A0A401S0A3_CHIPU|nr:hypothetical protein [Chiloscyllium punctatum]